MTRSGNVTSVSDTGGRLIEMEMSGSTAATGADLLDDAPRERLREVRRLRDLDEHVAAG